MKSIVFGVTGKITSTIHEVISTRFLLKISVATLQTNTKHNHLSRRDDHTLSCLFLLFLEFLGIVFYICQ